MPAFRAAVDQWGADMLELDVRLSRDGVVVIIHDETVDRTSDGTGAVGSFSFRELQELDAGYRFVDPHGVSSYRGKGVRFPRVEELLEAFPRMRLNIETKEPDVARPLVEAIRRHGAEDRVLVAAEFERCRRSVRAYPGPWGASRHQLFVFWLLHRLPGGSPYTPPADIIQVPEVWKGLRVVSPGFVKAAHARNLPVQVWTVDDPDDMRRLLAMGVDGIQSDRPDLLAEVLTDETGRPPAPAVENAAS